MYNTHAMKKHNQLFIIQVGIGDQRVSQDDVEAVKAEYFSAIANRGIMVAPHSIRCDSYDLNQKGIMTIFVGSKDRPVNQHDIDEVAKDIRLVLESDTPVYFTSQHVRVEFIPIPDHN